MSSKRVGGIIFINGKRVARPTTLQEKTMPIDQAALDNWFTYHKPEGDQAERYEKLRAAGKAFAEQILALTPPSADQSAAIRLVREAVFTANAAIACGGK